MAGARETQFLIYTRRRLRDVALCAHARTDARPAHALKWCRIASTAKSLPAGVCVVIDVKSALARDVWRAPRPPPALSLSAHGRHGVQQIACMSHGFVWNARVAKRRPFALQTFSGRAPPHPLKHCAELFARKMFDYCAGFAVFAGMVWYSHSRTCPCSSRAAHRSATLRSSSPFRACTAPCRTWD